MQLVQSLLGSGWWRTALARICLMRSALAPLVVWNSSASGLCYPCGAPFELFPIEVFEVGDHRAWRLPWTELPAHRPARLGDRLAGQNSLRSYLSSAGACTCADGTGGRNWARWRSVTLPLSGSWTARRGTRAGPWTDCGSRARESLRGASAGLGVCAYRDGNQGKRDSTSLPVGGVGSAPMSCSGARDV